MDEFDKILNLFLSSDTDNHELGIQLAKSLLTKGDRNRLVVTYLNRWINSNHKFSNGVNKHKGKDYLVLESYMVEIGKVEMFYNQSHVPGKGDNNWDHLRIKTKLFEISTFRFIEFDEEYSYEKDGFADIFRQFIKHCTAVLKKLLR